MIEAPLGQGEKKPQRRRCGVGQRFTMLLGLSSRYPEGNLLLQVYDSDLSGETAFEVGDRRTPALLSDVGGNCHADHMASAHARGFARSANWCV